MLNVIVNLAISLSKRKNLKHIFKFQILMNLKFLKQIVLKNFQITNATENLQQQFN